MPRLITSDDELRRLVPQLLAAQEIAVDTEFHPERTYEPRLMLLQLRVDDDDPVLVDPLAGVDLGRLAGPLSQARVVVHGGAADMRILRRVTGAHLNVVFDTQLAAAFVGDGYPVRLQDLAQRHLGLQMDKSATLSDWSRRPLSPEQLHYAAEDVLVLGPIRRALAAEVEARGYAELVDACCAEARAAAARLEQDEDAWQAVPGAGGLDAAERAALAALAAWRQREARLRDVPRYSLVSDALPLDIARRQPATVEALRANRRMPTNVWKVLGPEIIRILSAPGSPPPPLLSRPRGWGELVRAFGRVREASTGISADLLLPEPVLAALARGEAPSPWRARALGPDFVAFLKGKADIRVPSAWALA